MISRNINDVVLVNTFYILYCLVLIIRSAYFQQIEEDVQKYAATIMETKSAIDSFRTKDMTELLKFHQHVEQHLEKLTDETQVVQYVN